jgi:hypothetical protein
MPSEVSTIGGNQSVEELRRELAEARRREGTTTDILHIIGSSPTNLQPVFEAIVAHAARLCDAAFSAVAMFDRGLLVAVNEMSPEETACLPHRFSTIAGPPLHHGPSFRRSPTRARARHRS